MDGKGWLGDKSSVGVGPDPMKPDLVNELKQSCFRKAEPLISISDAKENVKALTENWNVQSLLWKSLVSWKIHFFTLPSSPKMPTMATTVPVMVIFLLEEVTKWKALVSLNSLSTSKQLGCVLWLKWNAPLWKNIAGMHLKMFESLCNHDLMLQWRCLHSLNTSSQSTLAQPSSMIKIDCCRQLPSNWMQQRYTFIIPGYILQCRMITATLGRKTKFHSDLPAQTAWQDTICLKVWQVNLLMWVCAEWKGNFRNLKNNNSVCCVVVWKDSHILIQAESILYQVASVQNLLFDSCMSPHTLTHATALSPCLVLSIEAVCAKLDDVGSGEMCSCQLWIADYLWVVDLQWDSQLTQCSKSGDQRRGTSQEKVSGTGGTQER